MLIKRRRWLWILLFIGVTLLLGGLATGWNIVLVLDHYSIVALAKNLALPPIEASAYSTSLIIKMILGTLGFLITLAMTVLLFIKLLNEMRLNQLQSEFLATLSHELKTPIATLELSSSLIRAGDLPPSEVNRLWKTHEEELRRLREEVEALLEAARWQSQSALTKMHPVRLESWIETSWERWKSILGPNAILNREGDLLDFKVPLDLRTVLPT
jgi:signal transduction histidine kinase